MLDLIVGDGGRPEDGKSESDWEGSHPELKLDAHEFFGGDPSADFDQWFSFACWSVDEATALSFGYDPRVVSWDLLKTSEHPFAEMFETRRQVIKRSIAIDEIKEPIKPIKFLTWAKKHAIGSESFLAWHGKKTSLGTGEAINLQNLKIIKKLAEMLTGLNVAYLGSIPEKDEYAEIATKAVEYGIVLDGGMIEEVFSLIDVRGFRDLRKPDLRKALDQLVFVFAKINGYDEADTSRGSSNTIHNILVDKNVKIDPGTVNSRLRAAANFKDADYE